MCIGLVKKLIKMNIKQKERYSLQFWVKNFKNEYKQIFKYNIYKKMYSFVT